MFWKVFKELPLKKKFEYIGTALLFVIIFFVLMFAAVILETIKNG